MARGADIIVVLLFIAPQLLLWRLCKRKIKKVKILEHKRRHNCVVTYSPISGCKGYMGSENVIRPTIHNLAEFEQPLKTFLSTAKKQIDIAVMFIKTKSVFQILKQKLSENVSVRIIVYVNNIKIPEYLRKLESYGAKILYFTGKKSIMHFKAAVKDSDVPNSRALVCGSRNWTNSLYGNFDDMLFTTNLHLVSTFQEAYNDLWKEYSNRKWDKAINKRFDII